MYLYSRRWLNIFIRSRPSFLFTGVEKNISVVPVCNSHYNNYSILVLQQRHGTGHYRISQKEKKERRSLPFADCLDWPRGPGRRCRPSQGPENRSRSSPCRFVGWCTILGMKENNFSQSSRRLIILVYLHHRKLNHDYECMILKPLGAGGIAHTVTKVRCSKNGEKEHQKRKGLAETPTSFRVLYQPERYIQLFRIL